MKKIIQNISILLFILAARRCPCEAFRIALHKSNLMSSRLYFSEVSPEASACSALKTKFYELVAKTSRGQIATESQKEEINDILFQLEAFNPTADIRGSLDGSWDLVFSDAPLFMSSPFFLTLRDVLKLEAEDSKKIFRLHREAANTGEIERVSQTINGDILQSDVDLRVGLVPGPPFSLRGTVVSRAKLEYVNEYTFKLIMMDTTVKNNNILRFLDQISLPINSLYEVLGKGDTTSELFIYYLDNDFRVVRNADGNVFVYSKN